MEFFDNKLCISVRELEADGILTQDYCRQLAARNRLKMAPVVEREITLWLLSIAFQQNIKIK